MSDVDYCVIAVRKIYRQSPDFEKVIQFMDALYSSNKLTLPLKGVLILDINILTRFFCLYITSKYKEKINFDYLKIENG